MIKDSTTIVNARMIYISEPNPSFKECIILKIRNKSILN